MAAEGDAVPVDDAKFGEAVRKYDEARNNLAALFPEPRAAAGDIGCSFCCRPAEKLKGVVAGVSVTICDECIVLAHQIMTEQGIIE
jgi:hypothetical protein